MLHERLPPPLRPADVDDDFTGSGLREDLWVDHYLPHWTTPERSLARYDLTQDGLRLRIEADQPAWRPEDAPLRVSSIQTADGSGPVGSTAGLHRHRPDGLVVRSARPSVRKWTPRSGRVEITVSASRDRQCMTAAWLVGTGQGPSRETGEICVFEIDADAIATDSSRVRSGLKSHGDPELTTDMITTTVPVDASRPHTWTAQWGVDGTVVACEGTVVGRWTQAPDYPMMLLIDLFEMRGDDPGDYPKSAVVHRVRGWSG